eukprot:scaffold680_cov264-Pinguiococcus_pyrenoidosus.AAC.3
MILKQRCRTSTHHAQSQTAPAVLGAAAAGAAGNVDCGTSEIRGISRLRSQMSGIRRVGKRPALTWTSNMKI